MNFHPNRVQPEQMARCPFDMTCRYPQGECMGACDLSSNVAPLAVDIALPDDSRMTLAIHTYRVYRVAGHSFWPALRKAIRAARRN
ncbi:hypothetical protein [Hydrogenophaga sp.]|uniref:hypothetical protein n=1 Tax=Hydrogenophaga sp. TaxID=1904254 RepID=UPI003D131731